MIAPGINYLIRAINNIIKEANEDTYVSTSVDMFKSRKTGNVEIDFNYLIHIDGTSPQMIATVRVKVDPEYYTLYKDEILARLNDDFFKQILLHTNFNDKPNLLDISNPWRLN